MADAQDYRHMAEALRWAERGRYTATPNPRVGCLITRGASVIGRGGHRRAGEPHAEALALAEAGTAARGASVYVTLEPCNHHGRTPPCTEALIAAGVGRVIMAMEDPDPRVQGAGRRRLEAAGIPVESGVLAAEAQALNPGFVKRLSGDAMSVPWVRLKTAASLDGRTALADGESRWITGEPARRDVHALRAAACVVLTGVDTVLADDPRLDVRLDADTLGVDHIRQPTRVILDSRLRTPPTARLFRSGGSVVVYTRPERIGTAPARSLQQQGAAIHPAPTTHDDRLDIGAILGELARWPINEIHIEAGATLSGALFAGGWVDEWVLYQAPVLLGSQGRPTLVLTDIATMAERYRLVVQDRRAVGVDWRWRLSPAGRAPSQASFAAAPDD